MLRATTDKGPEFSPSSSNRTSRRRRKRKSSARRHGSRAAVKMVPRVQPLEPRHLLSAILPAYVNDEFTFGDASSLAPYGLENTFSLQSRPDATKTIFLDFDGHHSVGNSWGHDIATKRTMNRADVYITTSSSPILLIGTSSRVKFSDVFGPSAAQARGTLAPP